MGTSQPQWELFFRDASIPTKLAKNYGTIFYENRMRFDMLDDIDKSLLHELGITAIGDVLAIMKQAKRQKSELPRVRTPSPEVEETKPVVKSSSSPDVKKNRKAEPDHKFARKALAAPLASTSKKSLKERPPRKTLSERFSEYETKAKKCKEEELLAAKKAEEKPPVEKNMGTIFTIQLPSKPPSRQPQVAKVNPTPKVVALLPAEGKKATLVAKAPTSIFDRLGKSTREQKPGQPKAKPGVIRRLSAETSSVKRTPVQKVVIQRPQVSPNKKVVLTTSKGVTRTAKDVSTISKSASKAKARANVFNRLGSTT